MDLSRSHCPHTDRGTLNWAEPDQQRVLPDAEKQIAVEEQADAPEHYRLLDVFHAGEGVVDTSASF